MRPKLIIDQHDRTCLLSTKVVVPEPEWLEDQTKPPRPTGLWFDAYPLTGGSVLVQEGAFSIIRSATDLDIADALQRANYFGKLAIVGMLMSS